MDCCRALDGNVWGDRAGGAVAQLGEHLLCKQGVSGSIPLSSTKSMVSSLRVLMAMSSEENTSLHRLRPDACSAYIVKRRLIWRLPGVGFYPASEPSSNDVVDGLAGWKRKRDWR